MYNRQPTAKIVPSMQKNSMTALFAAMRNYISYS